MGKPLFFDPGARQILECVDYDFTRLHVSYKPIILVCPQAKKLDCLKRPDSSPANNHP